ncbi:MAG: TfoX/Sxy family protein [Flavobacteriales bacterium]|nr:TfoX/Sxy family protein [Flavobacteriales bacterium]
MAHDTLLERRLRNALDALGANAEAKRMFGGVAFMIRGNMCVGVTNKGLFMVRVDPSREEELLARPGAAPMDFTGRPMKGYLFLDPDGLAGDTGLREWVAIALERNAQLPEK